MRGILTLVTLMVIGVDSQNRRPTISFITQPEIVTDIGGDVEMKCTIQYASDFPVIWMKLDEVDNCARTLFWLDFVCVCECV